MGDYANYLKLIDAALAKAGYSATGQSLPRLPRGLGVPPYGYTLFKNKNINDINEGVGERENRERVEKCAVSAESLGKRGQEGGQGCAVSAERPLPRKGGDPYRASADSFRGAFDTLIARPPEGVGNQRWVQAITDAESFLSTWGEQARAFGWTAEDLFRLDQINRYDTMGLIWLLQGCPVVALTERTAIIRKPTGNQLTFYRKDVEFPWRRHSRP
jgi:hypothetical protein